MANKKQLAILEEGVDVWNKWRRENPNTAVDLSEADLITARLSAADVKPLCILPEIIIIGDHTGGAKLAFKPADLKPADLKPADLEPANLSKADLNKARLVLADLEKANLNGANLIGANLNGANLIGANLIGANLIAANLRKVWLAEADLTNATFGDTTLVAVDLSTVKGLDSIDHRSPSYIDIDTFYKSKGNIPEGFLRGCGVPDNMIAYFRSLRGKAIEFYSCFISYSSRDQTFADRLYADLQKNGVRCWFAPHDMKIGDTIRDRIEHEIRIYEKLLLVLSEYSIASDWVESEVEAALEKERRNKRPVLFPLRIDDAVMTTDKGWAAKFRRARHIGDMRQWKDHDCYKTGFDRLLHDLKAEPAEG